MGRRQLEPVAGRVAALEARIITVIVIAVILIIITVTFMIMIMVVMKNYY